MSDSCSMCPGGSCKYAEGGVIKGVHEARFDDMPGTSRAGIHSASSSKWEAGRDHIAHGKKLHKEKLTELKDMPNPKLKGLAKGGLVNLHDQAAADAMEKGESDTGSNDGDMLDSVMGEFHDSLKSGDHKSALESLKAIIMALKE